MRDRKVRLTKVDAGDFKHELLNRLRSTMAVNVLKKPEPSLSVNNFCCLSESQKIDRPNYAHSVGWD